MTMRGPGAPRRGDGGRREKEPIPNRLPPMPFREDVEKIFAGAMLPRAPLAPHAGLVFERYLRIWQSDREINKGRRNELLQVFVREYGKLGEQAELKLRLQQLQQRQEVVLAQLFPGASYARSYRTAEYLASGMGNPHPLENGFLFDKAVGVPCLSATQIKGLCRATARGEAGIEELYGPEEISSTRVAFTGDIVFLPAYPRQWPELAVDIINNHQSQYYGGKDDNPTENESPVPVVYLAVKRGTLFTFRLGSRSGNRGLVERAERHLQQGLTLLGIGAKSALGYGVMTPT